MASARRIVRNILASFAGHGSLLLVGLVVVPILVHQLGSQDYGALALVNASLAFLWLLELGLGPAVVREYATRAAQGDRGGQGQVVASAGLCFVLQGLAGGLLMVLAAPALAAGFELEPHQQAAVVTALRLGGAAFAVRLALQSFTVVPLGLQQLGVLAKRRVMAGTAALVAQALLATLDAGLPALVAAAWSCEILGDLALVVWAVKRLGDPSPRPWVDTTLLRSLWRFSIPKWIHQVSEIVVQQADRLIVGLFLPVEAVAYYDVPLQLAQKLARLRDNISYAYFPAACEVAAAGDRERLGQFYLAANRYVVMAVVPLALGLAALAHPFLLVWIRKPDLAEASSLVLVALALAYGLTSLLELPGLTADATGRPQLTAGAAVAMAALQIGLSLLLVPRLGVIGAGISGLAAPLLVVPLTLHLINRSVVGVTSVRFASQCLVRPLLAGGLMAAVLCLAPEARGVLSLMAAVLLGALLYAGGLLATRALRSEDWRALRGVLQRAEKLPAAQDP